MTENYIDHFLNHVLPIYTDRSCFIHLQNPDAPWLTGVIRTCQYAQRGLLNAQKERDGQPPAF